LDGYGHLCRKHLQNNTIVRREFLRLARLTRLLLMA